MPTPRPAHRPPAACTPHPTPHPPHPRPAPQLDMHRPPYMLQEARLSTALLRAAAIPEGSDRWRRIKGWVDPT